MIKIKNKKVLILFLLILLDIVSNVSIVYATEDGPDSGAYLGAGYNDTGGGAGSGSGKPNTQTKKASDGYTITCSWTSSISQWSNVYINVYDNRGNKINNVDNIKDSIKNQNLAEIKAGTFIGLNIYEEKGYNISYEYNVTATKKKYSCRNCKTWCPGSGASPTSYEISKKNNGIIQLEPVRPPMEDDYAPVPIDPPSPSKPSPSKPSCTGCKVWYPYYYVYDDAYTNCDEYAYEGDETRSPSADEISWCKDLAKPKPPTLTPSYKAEYLDVNDINKTDIIDAPSPTCKINGTNNETRGSCIFEYNLGDATINLKTGIVSYPKIDYLQNNCSSNECMTIESKNSIWPYFIPLNTKSITGFSFRLAASGTLQHGGICLNIVEKYPDSYRKKIVDSTGKQFQATDDIEEVKKNVKKNGCYYRTIIEIPVVQEFYNEQNNGSTFKGFNFYYKPIDITNPFPNGIPTNSIWTESDVSSLTGTSIESDNITYIADVTDANAIRNYKDKETNYKKNTYTSWENMNKDGWSYFIENEPYMKRYVSKSNFFKLGCGPANMNKTNPDGTTNHLYQEECGTE